MILSLTYYNILFTAINKEIKNHFFGYILSFFFSQHISCANFNCHIPLTFQASPPCLFQMSFLIIVYTLSKLCMNIEFVAICTLCKNVAYKITDYDAFLCYYDAKMLFFFILLPLCTVCYCTLNSS